MGSIWNQSEKHKDQIFCATLVSADTLARACMFLEGTHVLFQLRCHGKHDKLIPK